MNNKTIALIVALLVIVAGLGYVFRGGFPLSIITPPTTVNLENGKVYWLSTLSVDSANENFLFKYKVGDNVNDYSLTNGDTVKPQSSFDVSFSVNKNQCEYTTKYELYNTFLTAKFPHYVLTSVNRNILYNVGVVKTGDVKTFSAFDTNSKIFTDSDGKGELVVKSLGSLQGMSDCPDGDNIWLCVDEDNVIRYIDEDKYLSNPISIAYNDICNVAGTKSEFMNTNFNQNFKLSDFEVTQNQFWGIMPDKSIGTALVTVAADQDFFDSVVYAPAEITDPIVSSITVSKLIAGSSGTMKVNVKNNADSVGYVQLDITCDTCSVIPQTQSVLLSDNVEIFFSINEPTTSTKSEICVEVCGEGNQFEAGNCDTECKTVIVEQQGGILSCGNNKCEPSIGENYGTCPQDCPQMNNCADVPFSRYDEVMRTCVCNDGYEMTYDAGSYMCVPVSDNVIYYIIGGAVLLVIIVYLVTRKPSGGTF